jgi:class 3 adenylate cyclase/HAMP domain-containing protein
MLGSLGGMRLRRKITVAFFLVSSLVSLLLAFFLYRFIEDHLGEEIHERLKDITQIGSQVIDRTAFGHLREHLGDLDEAATSARERSADYTTVYRQLRRLRDVEADKLLRFAYLLAPTADPAKPRFVADADVLDFEARAAKGEQVGEISHYSASYDASAIPLLVEALRTCEPRYEPDFVFDKEFGVRSISAYVPLTDLDGVALRAADGSCLGVLGVDIIDREMRDALRQAGGLAIWISLAVILLALIVSIAMGTVLTRSVLALTATVKRFADKDFSARSPRLAKDEIGQLGDSFNTMAQTIQIHSEHLEDLVAQRTKELSSEKATSERLLLNVLPMPIADRLKGGETLIVDRFDAVSVMFADIVGFTSMSSKTSPEKLVTMLNSLFRSFDDLAERHGIEKIKTIGDAYMAVAGVPEPIADHAVAMALMAMDMLDVVHAYAREHGIALDIRIGIHSGSVVAGVIGTKKFIYDLWGDTVNTASRMESHGMPGRVQVSEVTAAALGGQFELEDRGPVEIKGKGKMHTFLIAAQRKDPLRTSITAIIPPT